jgi:hypothetical protein
LRETIDFYKKNRVESDDYIKWKDNYELLVE